MSNILFLNNNYAVAWYTRQSLGLEEHNHKISLSFFPNSGHCYFENNSYRLNSKRYAATMHKHCRPTGTYRCVTLSVDGIGTPITVYINVLFTFLYVHLLRCTSILISKFLARRRSRTSHLQIPFVHYRAMSARRRIRLAPH